MSNTVVVNGQPYDASSLTLPDRKFREFWKTPVDGVVDIDWDTALPAYKAELKTKIDEDAEAFRQNYITPGDGMAMTYREKLEQATAANGSGKATVDALTEAQGIATYPTLAASVGIEADSVWEVAQLVIQKAETWADLSYAIEKKRLSGKSAIDSATTSDEVLAAYQAITWS